MKVLHPLLLTVLAIGHLARTESCSKNEFKCSIDGKCISLLKVQDGMNDCIDGSDEGLILISSSSSGTDHVRLIIKEQAQDT